MHVAHTANLDVARLPRMRTAALGALGPNCRRWTRQRVVVKAAILAIANRIHALAVDLLSRFDLLITHYDVAPINSRRRRRRRRRYRPRRLRQLHRLTYRCHGGDDGRRC